MTTADGTVQGTTQIFGGAPRAVAFNIVLLAEGFTAREQDAFNAAAQNFLTALRALPPYDEVLPKINVFRVNVTSTDSGADDPVATGGTGATVRTYFDASFGNNGIRRLLQCSTVTALQVATAQVPEHSLVLVVVNSTIYGGSGGQVATFSLAAGASEIAFHEAGHTAFGLADEYAVYAGGNETGHDHHAATEPGQPNITVDTDRTTLKWRSLVAAGTAIPTMTNPDCSKVDSRPSSVPEGTVGLFEGADYFHCGAYRPEYNCKMRTLGVPFCHVCRQVIRNRIGPVVSGVLQRVSVSPVRVTGGNSCRGTVTLVGPALIDTPVALGVFNVGTHIPLPNDESHIAHVPASVTIPAGQRSRSFTVTTSVVSPHTTQAVTIIAGASAIRYAGLTVTG